MLEALQRELHYQYRSWRLMRAFLSRRFIHCNLQITYRCNFRCEICDFWKETHSPEDELTVAQVESASEGKFVNQIIISVPAAHADAKPLVSLNVSRQSKDRPPPTYVVVTFTPEDGGTRVDLEHRKWEVLGAGAAESRASYNTGWELVLGLFAQAASA